MEVVELSPIQKNSLPLELNINIRKLITYYSNIVLILHFLKLQLSLNIQIKMRDKSSTIKKQTTPNLEKYYFSKFNKHRVS